jgi:hypothetical protein
LPAMCMWVEMEREKRGPSCAQFLKSCVTSLPRLTAARCFREALEADPGVQGSPPRDGQSTHLLRRGTGSRYFPLHGVFRHPRQLTGDPFLPGAYYFFPVNKHSLSSVCSPFLRSGHLLFAQIGCLETLSMVLRFQSYGQQPNTT